MSDFTLKIVNVFLLSDGRTVFACQVENGPKLIPAGEYDLTAHGQPVVRISIEGEMIPLRRDKNNQLRAVSTLAKLDPQLIAALKIAGEIRPIEV